MYATSLGTQRLRSRFPVPKEVRGFSGYLRDAGYYCSNNVKTDYNLRDEPAFVADAWDESSADAHWRKRRPGQPFFAVFNFMTTHQSRTSVWPHEQFEKEIGSKLSPQQRHDPAAANLPPYYPDTREARRAWARYHDCITRMDQEVGELLRQLEADGLAEQTVVFFYGDHGMGMPRGKRVLHDSGMQMPLVIRFARQWQDLAPAAPGETSDRLVSFVDYGNSCASEMTAKFFIGILLAPAALAAQTFRNPIIQGNLADPTVIEHEGRYYLYATGDANGAMPSRATNRPWRRLGNKQAKTAA